MAVQVESNFIFMDAEEHLDNALSEIKRIKNFYQKGYEHKKWKDRKPDIIRTLIEAEKKVVSAKLDIQGLHYREDA